MRQLKRDMKNNNYNKKIHTYDNLTVVDDIEWNNTLEEVVNHLISGGKIIVVDYPDFGSDDPLDFHPIPYEITISDISADEKYKSEIFYIKKILVHQFDKYKII